MPRPTEKQPALVPEYHIRVKLPSPSSYASCPSGDSDYDSAFHGAINTAKPPGFEVKWPKLGHKWAVDSEGFTVVPLFISKEKDALAYYMDRTKELEDKIKKIQSAVK